MVGLFIDSGEGAKAEPWLLVYGFTELLYRPARYSFQRWYSILLFTTVIVR